MLSYFFSRLRTLSTGAESNRQDFNEKAQYGSTRLVTLAGLGAATAAGLYYYVQNYFPKILALENKVEEAAPEREPGSYVDGLPVYSSNDVANHRDETTGVWISYKSGVYDITSFIKSHPGTITSMHLLY